MHTLTDTVLVCKTNIAALLLYVSNPISLLGNITKSNNFSKKIFYTCITMYR